ncbi:MAG: class I SAM-dependent methyltransferase [Proteobacteria bacterium]|nr:class I SAM-dependent methyltransferase [Pseudomonadota bacterium]
MFSFIKRAIRPYVPQSILDALARYRREKDIRAHDAIFQGKDRKYIFSEIYAKFWWGHPLNSEQFNSGHGSHFAVHVDPYVDAVSAFLQTFACPQNVVDLGCGDFNVGSRLRRHCATYVACDIAPDLLERNKKKFHDLNVDFRCLDIVADPLPHGDVVIVRQVLQHLSNEDIKSVATKLRGYKFLVLTEFVPDSEFTPNIDQPTGAFSRLARGIKSGVVLTEEPFSLKAKSERVICTSQESGALVTTIVYEL